MKIPQNSATVLMILIAVIMLVGAQSSTEDRSQPHEAQASKYWIDPQTGLIWSEKDNGKNLNWHDATKYCRKLRLAGYSDWRLATIDELQGIYDESANAAGLAGKHNDEHFSLHVKGNLFLTGDPWSSTQRIDDRGHPSGIAWYFDFINGIRKDEDASLFSGRFANYRMRALCVRPPA